MNQSLAYYASVLRKNFADYCNRRLSDQGLSQGQIYFIIYVGRHPGCSQTELAQGLHMDGGHTTRTLTRLVQDGFLLQKKSPVDRRAHTLTLTEKGKSAFQFSHELFDQWDEEMLGQLSPGEKEALLAVLGKLTTWKGGNGCV